MDSANNQNGNLNDGAGPSRRSGRPNIGLMPDRYGQPVYYNVRNTRPSARGLEELINEHNELRQRHRDVSIAEVPDRPNSDHVSVRTASSAKSTRSMRKRLEADLRVAEQLQAQKKEKLARERERLRLQAEFDRKADEEEFAAQQAVVNLQLALEKAQIDEEDALSQNLSEDEQEQGEIQDDVKENHYEPSIPLRSFTPPFLPQPVTSNHASVNNSHGLHQEPHQQQVLEKLGDVMSTVATAIESMARVTNENKEPSNSKVTSSKFLARQAINKDLLHFHGDPEEWPTFSAEFERSTKLCEYSDAENISRLQRCLKGKARDAVKSLLTVPENVNTIMKTLKLNFGRPDLIVETIIEKVRKMPPVKEGKFDMLLDFSNAVRNTVTTMTNLKSDGHLRNPQLIKELGLKLPANLQLQWAQVRTTKLDPDLECFADWLFDTANASSYFCTLKPSSEREQEKKGKTSREFATSEHVKESSSGSSSNIVKLKTCICCNKPGHEVGKCHNFTRMNHEDRWILARSSNVCFQCLKPGHRTLECKGRPCGFKGCVKHHHQMLHRREERKNSPEKPEEKTVLVCRSNVMKKTLLEILPVIVVGPRGEVPTYCLLDPGAEDSFIETDIATRVGLTGPRKPIRLMGPGISNPVFEKSSREVSCGLRAAHGKQVFKFSSVSTVKDLNLPRQSVDMKKLCEDWPFLKNVPVESYINIKPTILIGQDNCHLLTYDGKVNGSNGGPIAIKTELGWVVHGKTTSGGASKEESYVCHIRKEDDALHQLVKKSFQTEEFGVRVTTERKRSVEDTRAEHIMKNCSRQVTSQDKLTCFLDSWMFVEDVRLNKFETARWITGLPWKDSAIEMPESYQMALRRLQSIEKKMDKSQLFAAEYSDKIDTYINKGFARKLSSEEASIVGLKTWYLPHFDVINPNKPGKFRLVFDAAAKSNGVSLNDCLIQGPDLLNPLPNILLQFREKKVGFTADIRDMFHRVWIQKEDSCAQRFLWRGMDRKTKPSVYEMQVMVFGAVSSPYCAHYIKNLNADRFRKEFPHAVNGIIKKHYVDDYLDCADSEEEALKLIEDVRMIHRKGGFDIVGWTSSSRKILEKIPIEIQATGLKDMEPESSLPIARVLGLYWDPNDDVFTFTCNFIKVNENITSGGKIPTKREMLKLVMSVFDPLGFLSHFTVKAKILLQEVWRSNVDWDDEVSEEVFIKWCQWLKELKRIPQLKIPRCYSVKIPEATNIQLHLFCDASLLSFASVAFIRIECEDNIDVSFVMARTRVAPLKSMTLPRLELQGAVMAVRLAKTIQEVLSIRFDSIHFWTDNSCVLGWIRSDSRRFVTFVANRVGEIQEDSEVASWHWVPTSENVADDATRDKESCNFSPDSRWVNGPAFLKLKSEDWPKEKFSVVPELEESELKKVNLVWKEVSSEALPKIANFSSWLKLIRSTAYLVRFILKLQKKAPTNTEGWESWRAPVIQCLGGQVLRRSPRHQLPVCAKQNSTEVLPEEYLYAEKLWIRQSQWDSFPEEMTALTKKKQIDKSSKLWNLSPYLDNGIMKLRGRLDKSRSIEVETRRPVVLDPKHPYTILLIKYYHDQAKHIGQETVVNELRQKYWILNARAAVKASWNSCNVCKISRARPVVPEMGDLPEFRLNKAQRPFTYTGLDYFGPMEVTIGRRHEKRYGALFTCLSTRAVHLELANSLDTDSVIMALTRFIGRRGVPQKIYSDNGTNFHGANNELKKCIAAIDGDSIRKKFGHRGLDWIFNPPSAPHMGGVWERLVQSVKVALTNMLKSKFPKEEILATALVECERIVNSRPITHVPADPDDPEGLTPNHFLIGSSNGNPPYGDFTVDENPKQRWRHSQVLADHFWKRWVREYLPTLAKRTKWNKAGANLKVGDLVFIADGDLPRCQWPRGRIVAVFPGSDGNVRVADVKTCSGLYRRPVVKLCLLDVSNDVVVASPDTSTAGSMLPSSV